MSRIPGRLIQDDRQMDLVQFLEGLISAHAAVLAARAVIRQTEGAFDLGEWMTDMRGRDDVTRRTAPARLPKLLPFMVDSVSGLACYTPEGDWLADDFTCSAMLAAAVLHSAWKDASWVEKPSWRAETLKQNPDAVRKRSRKAEHRISGIGFFLVPPPPPSVGWCPTLDSWCDVIGFDADVVRSCVEAHLRSLSALHCELCDYVQCDMEPAEPERFFNRNGRA